MDVETLDSMKRDAFQNPKRGTHLIIPLHYKSSEILSQKKVLKGYECVDFSSVDFTAFLTTLLCSDTFAKRYRKVEVIQLSDNIAMKQVEFYFYQHGIGFLNLYLEYENNHINEFYQMLQPGYHTTSNSELSTYIVGKIEEVSSSILT